MMVFLLSWQGNLRTYRYCDSVWTFNLRDVTFRNGDISQDIGKLKIVACDSSLLKPKVPPQQ
jgi:transcription initiation factor TFIIA small subunit